MNYSYGLLLQAFNFSAQHLSRCLKIPFWYAIAAHFMAASGFLSAIYIRCTPCFPESGRPKLPGGFVRRVYDLT